MTRPSVGVVADDLTGAMDTAAGFAARGHGTAVVVTPAGFPEVPHPSPPERTVVATDTDTRYADPETARRAVRDAVDALSPAVTYLKIDSTLRGNVAATTTAALAAGDADLALVAPVFPATGRRTVDGVHRVDGTPVTDTEYGADANGPATADLAALFGPADAPVERLPVATVEAGVDRTGRAIDEAVAHHDAAPVVVADATTERHIATIADAGADRDTLYVGSGGLAAHVAVEEGGGERNEADASDAGSAGPTDDSPSSPGHAGPLGVVGSVSETTLGQLDRVDADRIVAVEGAVLLDRGGDGARRDGPDDPPAGATDAVEGVVDRIESGRPAVLTGATDRAAVERTVAAGRERGLDPSATADRVAEGLAAVAAAVVRRTRPSGLVLTGGDVAVAGLRALEATTVDLAPEGVETGIPLGRVRGGAADGLAVATKAGGFGGDAAIVNCLDAVGSRR